MFNSEEMFSNLHNPLTTIAAGSERQQEHIESEDINN